MSIDIKNYGVIDFFGTEIWITETLVNTWIIMAVLILLAIIGRIIMSKPKKIPDDKQNMVEIVVEKFDNFVTGTVGENLSYMAPWFFTVFIYLIAGVVMSLLGFRAPASDFVVTFALAACSFIIMIYAGIAHAGPVNYLKSLMVPSFLFLPVNLIGELAKPISLSFRLFGNMLSGTLIIIMYHALTPWWASLGVPVALHLIFDVFFGLLQAYIFVIISLSYIAGAAES